METHSIGLRSLIDGSDAGLVDQSDDTLGESGARQRSSIDPSLKTDAFIIS
jgi:hypothetical protein